MVKMVIKKLCCVLLCTKVLPVPIVVLYKHMPALKHTHTNTHPSSDGMLLLREAKLSYLRIVQGHLTAKR